MKKLKIYLDTSVISMLDQTKSQDRMADSQKLWTKIKKNEFDVVLSTITLDELNKNKPDKKAKLLHYLKQIKYSLISINEKSIEVASRFVNLGILKQKSFDDCQHIAAAIISECDVIVSWNFKHIVNHKTIEGVKAVTALEGYDDVLIYSPSILIGGE
ncbi:MAG: PIN domain-containing protein [Endomicrobium sp.]|jgi:predicted nucleic acid-binding protein|nr:PIN domain-containing protein [Endomicrobium sp.]